MKINTLIIAITLLVQHVGFSQVDLDSLKFELEKSFIKERSSNDWNAYTIKYLDEDSLVRYVIPFSKEGKIEEDIWGIALCRYEYDEQNRRIEQKYYDIEGMLHFSDWPPIIRLYYDDKNRIIRKDYFGETEEPVAGFARIEYDYTEDGKVKEERLYDNEYNLRGKNAIIRFEYEYNNKVVIESRHDENLELVTKANVAYRRDEYESSERVYLIETRYWDKKRNLIMIEDELTKTKYAVVKYTYQEDKQGAKVEKFDSEMTLVNTSWKYVAPKKQ